MLRVANFAEAKDSVVSPPSNPMRWLLVVLDDGELPQYVPVHQTVARRTQMISKKMFRLITSQTCSTFWTRKENMTMMTLRITGKTKLKTAIQNRAFRRLEYESAAYWDQSTGQ